MAIRLRKDLGAQIKSAREAKQLTQKEMARRLDIHEASYCRFESDPSKARASTLIPALTFLGLTNLREITTEN